MPLVERIANRLLAVRHKRNTLHFIEYFGRYPNYWSPRGHTEKIQWRKLFDRDAHLSLFCDKLASRDYVAERAPSVRLARLLWSGDDPASIPFDRLEPPFVVKPNNRCGAIIKVRTPGELDPAAIRATARQWLTAPPHGRAFREWGYGPVRTQIMIEGFLHEEGDLHSPPAYKVHVFNGRAAFILYISSDNADGVDRRAAYTPQWERLPWVAMQFGRPLNYVATAPRPPRLAEMVAAAEAIAGDVDYVRVDLYCVDGEIYFGELTPYQSSGYAAYVKNTETGQRPPPRELDDAIGDLWTLPRISPLTRLWRGLFG